MVHFMKRKTNGNGKAAIISELERLANQSDDADNWRALVRSVKDAKTKSHVELEEAILRAAQAMKNAGVLKGFEAMYFIAGSILIIAEDRTCDKSPALNAVLDRISEVEKQHDSEGSEEYEKLSDEFDRLLREIIISTFEEYGETDLAAMYRYDEEAFHRLYERGRLKFLERKKITH